MIGKLNLTRAIALERKTYINTNTKNKQFFFVA
jgi:hypothetical protein